MNRQRHWQGFTLVELLVTVALIGVLAALSAPLFITLLENTRLRSATEGLYDQLKLAQSEAIKRGIPIYISFTTGSNWCYGVSDVGACNCGTANACLVNGVEVVTPASSVPGTSLAISGLTGSSPSYVQFTAARGTPVNNGSVSFTSGTSTTTITLDESGGVNTCSNQVPGYGAC